MANPYPAQFTDDNNRLRVDGSVTFTDSGNQPGGGGSSPVLVQTTALSSAQILALHDTAVEIIPAPGAGKCVILIGVSARLTFGTVAYTIGSSGQPKCGYAGQAQNQAIGSMAPTTITATSDHIDADVGGFGLFHAQSAVVNKALMFFVTNANPADGDGTLQVTAWYVVDEPA